MTNKILKIFVAFSMLFTIFSIPQIEVKANELEVVPFAAIKIMYPDGSETEEITVTGWYIKYTVKLTGEYYVDASGNIVSENISAVLVDVEKEDDDVYPRITACKTTISGTKATTKVTVGFVNNLIILDTTVIHTFTNSSK